MKQFLFLFCVLNVLLFATGCSSVNKIQPNPDLTYNKYKSNTTDKLINREHYYDKLQGFWLGTCIANWTGLVTEMDKIGNIGELKTGNFYTRKD